MMSNYARKITVTPHSGKVSHEAVILETVDRYVGYTAREITDIIQNSPKYNDALKQKLDYHTVVRRLSDLVLARLITRGAKRICQFDPNGRKVTAYWPAK